MRVGKKRKCRIGKGYRLKDENSTQSRPTFSVNEKNDLVKLSDLIGSSIHFQSIYLAHSISFRLYSSFFFFFMSCYIKINRSSWCPCGSEWAQESMWNKREKRCWESHKSKHAMGDTPQRMNINSSTWQRYLLQGWRETHRNYIFSLQKPINLTCNQRVYVLTK